MQRLPNTSKNAVSPGTKVLPFVDLRFQSLTLCFRCFGPLVSPLAFLFTVLQQLFSSLSSLQVLLCLAVRLIQVGLDL